MDSGFERLNFGFFVSGTWIRDSSRLRDFEFLEFNSGFISPDNNNNNNNFINLLKKAFQLNLQCQISKT